MSHIVLEVSDLRRAEEFYHRVLGLETLGGDLWPDCGRHVLLRTAGSQYLILVESSAPRTLADTGVHQAYRVSPDGRRAVAAAAERLGVAIQTYKEDRPAEEKDNLYFSDPDGNRIQLVSSPSASAAGQRVEAIDHAAVECSDLESAEDFYVTALGLPVDHRVGWSTADYVRATVWGEGKEEMAPGTRRWDQRYTVMDQKRRLPRPNPHFYVRCGEAVLGIFLATEHRQDPPEEQVVGTPRIAFRTTRRGLTEIRGRLVEHRFPVQGPVEHPASVPIAASLYFKDPGGNFLEVAVPR